VVPISSETTLKEEEEKRWWKGDANMWKRDEKAAERW
jgi:hypothetical protein